MVVGVSFGEESMREKWFGVCSRILHRDARRGLDDMQQWSVTVRLILEGDLPGQRLGKKEEEKVWA